MTGNDRFKVIRDPDNEYRTVICTPGFQQIIANLQSHFPEYALVVQRLVECQQSFNFNKDYVFCRKTFCSRYSNLYGKFQKVTAMWNRLLDHLQRFSVVRSFCVDDDSVACLDQLYENCVELDTSVAELLAQARERFPRFFLLLDEQLLRLLGSPISSFATRADEDCIPPLTNLFDFHSLVLQQGTIGIQCVGVRGRDGVIFFLEEAVIERDNLVDLFDRVTSALRVTLRNCVKKAVLSSPLLSNQVTALSPRHTLLPKHLLLHHPPQVGEILLRLRFTNTVDNFLMHNMSLHDLQRQEEAILNSFSTALTDVTTKNTKGQENTVTTRPAFSARFSSFSTPAQTGSAKKHMEARETAEQCKVLNRLLAIQMQHVDIVKYLMKHGADSVNSLCWKEQVRFYWSDVRESVMIDVGPVDIEYGYTYHDWADPYPSAIPPWETARKLLYAYKQPSIVNLSCMSMGDMHSVLEAVKELARIVGRYCHVCKLNGNGNLMFNSDGSVRMSEGNKVEHGLIDNNATNHTQSASLGKLKSKKGVEAPPVRAVHSAPILPNHQGAKESVLKLLAGCFSTGCWLVLQGLHECNVSVRATVRRAFEGYASALLSGGESSTMLLQQLRPPSAPPPTANDTATETNSTKLTVMSSVLITCTPSDEEHSGESVLFSDSVVRNSGLQRYVGGQESGGGGGGSVGGVGTGGGDSSKHTTQRSKQLHETNDKIKKGIAQPGQLAIVISHSTATPTAALPQTLTSCANFSVPAARQAAQQFQEVAEFMAGFSREIRKSVPLTEQFFRWICGICIYINSPNADPAKVGATVTELQAFALAVHALILPRLPVEEEGSRFLSEFHHNILHGTVDFLWLYSLCQQPSRNQIMAAVHSKGLQLTSLSELWRPDTPPGIAGIQYIAAVSKNMNVMGQLQHNPVQQGNLNDSNNSKHNHTNTIVHSNGNNGNLNGITNTTNTRQTPPGNMGRRKPNAPMDTYITRMQGIILCLRAAHYLLVDRNGEQPVGNKQAPFLPPTAEVASSHCLSPTRHIIITGEKGCGKTLSFYVLRSALHQLSFTTLTAAVFFGDSEHGQNCMEDGHVVKLGIHSASTVPETIGTVDPTSLKWIDGALTKTIRYGLNITQQYLDAQHDPNAVFLGNIKDVNTLANIQNQSKYSPDKKMLINPQHFWIHVNGAPCGALSEHFTSLLTYDQLVLPTGEILKINPYIHFVFELVANGPGGGNSGVGMLYSKCLLLHVPKHTFKPQPSQKKNGKLSESLNEEELRTAACVERDISGAIVAEDDMRAAFERLDTNGNGWVSKEEFKREFVALEHFGLGPQEGMKLQDHLMKYGLDDDKMTYDEFAIAMLKLAQR